MRAGKYNELQLGEQVGNWTLIEKVQPKNGRTCWLCRCKCGRTFVVGDCVLKRGDSKQCKGCASKKSKTKHGLYFTRLHRIWGNMKKRCGYPKDEAYKNYGGRGISVCEEWKNDFKAFYDWAMANGYKDTLSIDRINNDGNYEPANCRWATRKEQAQNKRVCK